ncbi:PTS sugar transporter subunit IIA [Collinsella sp. zg1085]|uniref:PTS sugar transporter subunit IIA n=1 Tax=Collinsella sp. zg1085 TaxID=2844380 RepID=UPI001C0D0B4E|nr:PTS sugar transporter subunit IIA [Collinsella sp. zg1085]QWT17646.1 PTS sugar transporter subunit IIA [Collinsella sp. zg1085]
MTQVDAELFASELVFLDIDVEDRTTLFAELGKRLRELGYIKENWFEAITKREVDYPTGLACQAINVAIPHTEPEHLIKPYIAVIKPKQPVLFEAMAHMGNDVPAQLVVNLGLLAHEDSQVAALQALMACFMNEEACADILGQTSPEGMVEAMRKYCAV